MNFNMEKFFIFLKNPTYEYSIHSLKEKIKDFLLIYLFCLIFILTSGLFILLIKHIFESYFHISSYDLNADRVENNILAKFGNYSLLIIGIVGPIIEELIFRLYLNLKKITIAISFSLLIYGLTGPIWGISDIHNELWRASLVILTFIIILTAFNEKMLIILREKFFMLIYYFSVLLFAFLHIGNFHPLDWNIFFIYPILVLPQIGMGLSLGYIRIKFKNGLLWAVLFHVLINMQGFLLHKV